MQQPLVISLHTKKNPGNLAATGVHIHLFLQSTDFYDTRTLDNQIMASDACIKYNLN